MARRISRLGSWLNRSALGLDRASGSASRTYVACHIIRDMMLVAGKPNSKHPLGLPKPAAVEGLADPKSTLQRTLECAAQVRGRRLARGRFNEHRRLLLEQLDIDGPVANLVAWQALERDIKAILSL